MEKKSQDSNFDNEKLQIIEWNHLDMKKFYPLALVSSWSVRCLLYPMSVIRARLQLQKQNNVYSGMCHAFNNIVRKEGFTALYKGFWITVPQITASFIYSGVYEKCRDVISTKANITSAPICSAFAGGVASTCTQLIFVPTDIIAQYMMIHNNPNFFTGGSKNVSVFEAMNATKHSKLTLGLRVVQAIYKVDGFKGFYRGFFSSLFLYIPSSMVFWSSYYNFLSLLKQMQAKYIIKKQAVEQKNFQTTNNSNENKDQIKNLLLLQGLSGSLSGISAAIFTNPLEILRIRIQVHRTGFFETIKRLYKFEGFRVFTKGLAPRMISNSIYSCLLMIGYETVKRTCVLPEFQNSIVW